VVDTRQRFHCERIINATLKTALKELSDDKKYFKTCPIVPAANPITGLVQY